MQRRREISISEHQPCWVPELASRIRSQTSVCLFSHAVTLLLCKSPASDTWGFSQYVVITASITPTNQNHYQENTTLLCTLTYYLYVMFELIFSGLVIFSCHGALEHGLNLHRNIRLKQHYVEMLSGWRHATVVNDNPGSVTICQMQYRRSRSKRAVVLHSRIAQKRATHGWDGDTIRPVTRRRAINVILKLLF